MTLTDVRVLDSVTQLDGAYAGVVVAASHGGVYAGHLAAAPVRAVWSSSMRAASMLILRGVK